MKFKPTKKVSLLFSLLAVFGAAAFITPSTRSANLTSVSVTLSNPRLSFRGSLGNGNTAGSSQVTILTAGAHPSLSTAQLLEGDSIAIGEAGSLGVYTVASTNPTAEFTTTTALAAGDVDLNDDVISTQSATHTIRFTTATAIANGRFRILVPSVANNTNAADGIPDGDFFDFGASAPTVTCPTDITGYDFVTGTASASAITLNGTDYHAYECAYSGTGAVGSAFNGTTNDAITISSIINPAPESGHTTGTANSHVVVIQHIDGTFDVADTTSAAVGVIEAVKVTATVDPTISFSISGVASGQTRCGVSTDVTTTAAAVPFGSLSLSAFGDAAQSLNVSTNAVNGYSVTAIENDQLGLNGGTCTGDNTGNSCIRDSVGDNTGMSHTASDEWTNLANKGFAYSLQNTDANTVAFQYSTATGNCTGTYCARQFADAENSQSAVQLFNSSTVADNETVEVCYRIIPSVTNAAGNYENNLIYTATATF
jgi:hypothetical protein